MVVPEGKANRRLPILIVVALAFAFVATLFIGTKGTERRAIAQSAPLICSEVLGNGGFESPAIPQYTFQTGGLDDWTGDYEVYRFDSRYSGAQYVDLNPTSGAISQVLDTSQLLAGDTIIIEFYYDNTLWAHLGTTSTQMSYTQAFDWKPSWITYTLTNDAEPVTLSFDQAILRSHLDQISATCTRPPSTFTPTSTSTLTPTSTATATSTTFPTSTATVSATSTTAVMPIPDTSLILTGDPRFPITGSAAIPSYPGLTYALETPPTFGTVIVDPEGNYVYTYTGPIFSASADQFEVLATASDGRTAIVTVVIQLVVDPSVPTNGIVKPGSTGYGGPADDARTGSTGNPVAPTTTPSSDPGRSQRP